MLTPDLIKEINEFVYKQPRTITEVASIAKVSWLTADKYITYISEKYGTIKVKTFRGGTRGAVKIVYWSNFDSLVKPSTAQHILLEKIKYGKKKHDFNPFDIYNFVDENKKNAKAISMKNPHEQHLENLLRGASRQLFIFSGNISFINSMEGNIQLLNVLADLARRKVNIKILCRADIASIKNIKKIIEINKTIGFDAVEIRHTEQPLRGFIIDDRIFRLREEKAKKDYKEGELNDDLYILYDINDRDWIEWGEKVFWNMYTNALPIENRIKALERIENLISGNSMNI